MRSRRNNRARRFLPWCAGRSYSPYGKALVAELGKSLRKDADPACLIAKGIAPEQLEPHGRDLVIKWGEKLFQTLNDFIDPKVYEEKFAATAGRSASAELKRLRNDPVVKRSLELERPIRQASVLDAIFEQFDRYMLVKRIKLTAVSPLGTANEALIKMNRRRPRGRGRQVYRGEQVGRAEEVSKTVAAISCRERHGDEARTGEENGPTGISERH